MKNIYNFIFCFHGFMFGILTAQSGDFSGYGYLDLGLTIEEAYGMYHYSYLIGGPKFINLCYFNNLYVNFNKFENCKKLCKKILDIEKNSYFYSLVFWFL